MAKVDFEIAVAFAEQTSVGVIEATLDAFTTGTGPDGDVNGTDEGLLLGASGAGIGESGLDVEFEAVLREKPPVSGFLTRSIDDFLRARASTFTFAFPYVGSRRTTTVTTQVDGDFVPSVGFNAILQAAALNGAAWGGGVGHIYNPDLVNTLPMTAWILVNETLYKIKDCLVETLSISFPPGDIPIATATIKSGEITAPASTTIVEYGHPATSDYGPQATQAAPTVETVAFTWQNARGFSDMTVTVSNTVEEINDSNDNATGKVNEITAQEITADFTAFVDDSPDAAGRTYEASQLFPTAQSELDNLAFTVGVPEISGGGSLPAEAVTIDMNTPRVRTVRPLKLGSKGAVQVGLVARNAVGGNEFSTVFE